MPQRVDDVRTALDLREHVQGLLLDMEITSFAVVPLRSTSEQFGLATWQGRDVPAVGVVILSKDEHDHRRGHRAPDAVRHVRLARRWCAPATSSACSDSSEQHAVEKEWLYWMVNGFADPVVLTDANNDIILQNLRAETLFKTSRRRQRRQGAARS